MRAFELQTLADPQAESQQQQGIQCLELPLCFPQLICFLLARFLPDTVSTGASGTNDRAAWTQALGHQNLLSFNEIQAHKSLGPVKQS